MHDPLMTLSLKGMSTGRPSDICQLKAPWVSFCPTQEFFNFYPGSRNTGRGGKPQEGFLNGTWVHYAISRQRTGVRSDATGWPFRDQYRRFMARFPSLEEPDESLWPISFDRIYMPPSKRYVRFDSRTPDLTHVGPALRFGTSPGQ